MKHWQGYLANIMGAFIITASLGLSPAYVWSVLVAIIGAVPLTVYYIYKRKNKSKFTSTKISLGKGQGFLVSK